MIKFPDKIYATPLDYDATKGTWNCTGIPPNLWDKRPETYISLWSYNADLEIFLDFARAFGFSTGNADNFRMAFDEILPQIADRICERDFEDSDRAEGQRND